MEFQSNDIYKALDNSYKSLAPYSNKQRWEFDSNLFHLSTIVSHVSKSDRIIDVGCGIGILALALKNLGFDVCGVDKYVFEPKNSYNVSDIDGLKKIWERNKLNISSGDVLSGPDGRKFDVVVSVAVIEHQRYLRNFIENLLSFVGSGGKVYVATPNVSNLLNRFRMFFGRAPMANVEAFYINGESFNGHWREYNPHELKVIAKSANTKVIEVGAKQTTKPHFSKDFKKWHVSLFRMLAYIIPGTGDTSYIWIQK